jgi:hypothetical protein
MKKVVMIMGLLLTIAVSQGFAQDTKTKKDNFSWQKVYMDEAGIPVDIQVKIDSIKQVFEPKMKAIRKDASLDENAKKEKIKTLNKEKVNAIEVLLTKEQKAKIKTIKERLKKENEG